MSSSLNHSANYQTAREPRYAEFVEHLDAIWALALWLRNQGNNLPSIVDTWIDEIAAIKAAVPKPVPPPAPGGGPGSPDPYDP